MSSRLFAGFDDRRPKRKWGPVCVLTNMCTGTHESEVVRFLNGKGITKDSFYRIIKHLGGGLAKNQIPQWGEDPQENEREFISFVEQIQTVPYLPKVHVPLFAAYHQLTGKPLYCPIPQTTQASQ